MTNTRTVLRRMRHLDWSQWVRDGVTEINESWQQFWHDLRTIKDKRVAVLFGAVVLMVAAILMMLPILGES